MCVSAWVRGVAVSSSKEGADENTMTCWVHLDTFGCGYVFVRPVCALRLSRSRHMNITQAWPSALGLSKDGVANARIMWTGHRRRGPCAQAPRCNRPHLREFLAGGSRSQRMHSEKTASARSHRLYPQHHPQQQQQQQQWKEMAHHTRTERNGVIIRSSFLAAVSPFVMLESCLLERAR